MTRADAGGQWQFPRSAGSRPSTASCCAARADPNPVLASSMLINGYVEHRIGWDFDDESPGPRRAGLRPRGRDAAGDRDAPRQHRAHQRRALLRRPRAPRVLHAGVLGRARARRAPTRRGSGSSPARCRPPAACSTPARRSSSTRTTPTARATRTARHENYLVDRAVPFASLVRNLLPVVRQPAGVHRRGQGRHARTARPPSTTRSASAPTSSRRRSGSRPR